ncbi:MAG: PilW family protein [Desulfuromonadaceae bacterium]
MRAMLKNRRGFTLTELIIVMVIFLVVMMISAKAFKTIVDNSSQQSKSVETQIEGIVGLEVLRADLEQAGFGLPWTFQTAITYEEATDVTSAPASFWPTGKSPAFFNDAGAPGNPPRAILSGTTTFNKDADNIGSSYLVIKSTLAATNNTSKKWTTVSFDKDNVKSPPRLWGAADRDLASTERVVVVKDSLMTTPPTRQLMASAATVFSAPFGTYSTLTLPHQNGDTFEIYGVSPATPLRMPFNRADYYVTRPADKMPASCSANTGILYKSTINHSNGDTSVGMPLLDCVADMQVVYGLDTSGGGFVNDHRSVPLVTAEEIRNQLKEIRVYILAQEGRKDLSYRYPSETIMVGEKINGTDRGRLFNLKNLIGADYKYYRWKVYTIVVRPKNLIQ